MTQCWFDPRLIYTGAPGAAGVGGRRGGANHDADYLNGGSHASSVWLPTPYVQGLAVTVAASEDSRASSGDSALRIYSNGSIEYTIR